jgi:hypothetical protein
MRFTISFDLDNDEFQFPKGAMKAGIRRVLHEVAGAVQLKPDTDLRKYGAGGKVADINGNSIGKWEIER